MFKRAGVRQAPRKAHRGTGLLWGMPDALIVFAKVPSPGAVKTRLCPPLTPAQAADLYAAMLGDALAQYAALGPAVRLYLAPTADGAALPDGLVPDGVTVHAQEGRDLGARMLRAFAETFHAGFARAVVVGTDHPTLPDAFLRLAFDHLDAPHALTLGPSDDGGYYLLGLRDLARGLFAGMTWSHAGVLDATLARAADADLAVTLLPPWYDVDDAGGLARLRADLVADPAVAPRTRAALARLGETAGS